jgi:hypothetical protein
MATTILQGNRVFEVDTPTTIAQPTLKDNNGNVWSNVVLNCNTTTANIQVQLPDLATLGSSLDCEIIINKTDASANDVNIIAFSSVLPAVQNYIGSIATNVPLTVQWQSAILRPASSTSWAIEFSA